jgi:protein-S-isoprenylcysteine O-methyltransferase Ste14
MTQPRKFWMRWRVRFGYLVALIFFLLASPRPRSILIGAMIAGFGLFIRAAASGHLRKDRQLAITGPYARMRNPLYFGSAFLAAGFVVAGNSWSAAGLVTAYFVVFYSAVMRNEESDLRASFGAPFDEYAARVPLFFPRLIGAGYASSLEGKPTGNFSWEQYRRNREYQAFIGMLAGLVALWLRMWLRAKFGC